MSEYGLFDKAVNFRCSSELMERYELLLFQQFGHRISVSTDLRELVERRVTELAQTDTSEGNGKVEGFPDELVREATFIRDVLCSADPRTQHSSMTTANTVLNFIEGEASESNLTPATVLVLCAAVFAQLMFELDDPERDDVRLFLERLRDHYEDDMNTLLTADPVVPVTNGDTNDDHA